jgi:hypothetical protein
MKWPEACKLIEKIKAERPELIVDHYATGNDGSCALRVYCILKNQQPDDEGMTRRLIKESVSTIYGPAGWVTYKVAHPEPFCRPEDSYHTDALGREVNHRGQPILEDPPPATPITAEEMLERIVTLGRSDSEWWKKPEKVAALAMTWGARVTAQGNMAEFESEEVARLGPDCHASVLIARTGSGLFASGFAARWGDGGTLHEPSVGSVPFDTEPQARRAAMKDLIQTLQGRGTRRPQQRQLLLEAVVERDKGRGLFG